jgi:hypothetical protein
VGVMGRIIALWTFHSWFPLGEGDGEVGVFCPNGGETLMGPWSDTGLLLGDEEDGRDNEGLFLRDYNSI